MTLSVGTRIGSYEIIALLGSGGMGEVYRARDTRLKRDVAIKILPDAFTLDPERLARFQREAEVLASLNHANIAQIYGLEQDVSTGSSQSGRTALVLELVDGPTLADRIAQGPIPLDEGLSIAKQMAEALEAAHDRGIVHRDLKPANIKITADGKVKVLDFGLAKAAQASDSGLSAAGLSQSPTITSPAMTMGGVILGTAAYMSPEQAKGKPVDRRADLWAFGCVLYEMLTGRRAFDAEDVSETLAAVLRSEPDWKLLPSGVPPPVESLVRRCLERDPKRRIADIAVASFLLDEAVAPPQAIASVDRTTRPSGLVWWKAAAVVLGVATAALAFVLFSARQSPNQGDTVRFEISPPAGAIFYSGVSAGVGYTGGSISPDGRQFAFTARGESGRTLLWIRRLDSVVARRIDGSEGAGIPFWSPDSRWVGFFVPGELRKVEATGGRPMKVCTTQTAGRGGSWNDGGEIVFGILRGTVYRVSATGGEPVPVTSLEPGDFEHRDPAFLPGGRHFFYAAASMGGDAGNAALVRAGVARPLRETNVQVRIGSIDGSKRDFVIQADSKALYAAPGLAVFIRNGTLLAQKFDAERLQVAGDPSTVVEGVAYASSGAFSVSDTGTLAFRTGPGAAEIQLNWIDRSGRPLNQPSVPGANLMAVISPDETRVAVVRPDLKGSDLWVLDIASGRESRLTFDPAALNTAPVWSSNGQQIAFGSRRNGKWGIYVLSGDGSGQERLVTTTEGVALPTSWSADGKYLVYSVDTEKTRRDIWTLSLADGEKPVPFLQTPSDEHFGAFSPDGRWIAYDSNETGTYEIYVRPFPERPGRWQVSNAGGELPQWRADGKELFYLEGEFNTRNVMAVDLSLADTTLTNSTPRVLFFGGRVQSVPSDRHIVSRDGQRFLMHRASAESEAVDNPVTVVLNWTRTVGLQ